MKTSVIPRGAARSSPEGAAFVRETCVEIIRRAREERIAILWRNIAGLWTAPGKIPPDVVGYLIAGNIRGQLVAFEVEIPVLPRTRTPPRPRRAWELEILEANGTPIGHVRSVDDALFHLRELAECPFTRQQLREPIK